MKQPTEWHDRLEMEDGQIYRILTAEYCDRKPGGKWYSCDVYKENDAGESWSQNLYQSMWGSSVVAFPGLPVNENKNSWYYDLSIAEEEGWYSRNRTSSIGWSDKVTEQEKETVCELYPDFRYVLNKWQMKSKAELMEKLKIWIVHNEVELILAAGYEKVAMNKNFYRLTEKNQKAVCLFMRKNPRFKDLTLREIREAMKADSPEDYARYLSDVPIYHRSSNSRACYPCISYKDYKYLMKILPKSQSVYGTKKQKLNQLENLYCDYQRMLYSSEHNTQDEYWRYPSDLESMHDRLIVEEARKEAARQLELKKADEEKNRQRAKALKAIEKEFRELNGSIDGYSIFVTSNYDEWEKQAEALHQCICAAGYYQDMADGMSTLVFIQKDGIPQATAQVMPDGKINQFYADETDHMNCLPSPEIKSAFNKWLENVPKSKFRKCKPRQKKSGVKEVAA